MLIKRVPTSILTFGFLSVFLTTFPTSQAVASIADCLSDASIEKLAESEFFVIANMAEVDGLKLYVVAMNESAEELPRTNSLNPDGTCSPVRFLSMPMDQVTLFGEMTSITKSLLPEVKSQVEISPSMDFYVVTVQTGANLENVREIISKLTTHLPFRVVEGEVPDASSAAWRWNDIDPMHAGAAIQRPIGTMVYQCSLGFLVNDGGTRRYLSSQHCDPTGKAGWRNGNGVLISGGGLKVDVTKSLDSMIITTDLSSYSALAYIGSYNSSSTIKVGGAGTPFSGEEVCVSGARSGEHCGSIINGPYTAIVKSELNGEDLVLVGYSARRLDNGPMVISGDSGGPVYRVATDGRAYARGIITAGSDPAPDIDGTPCTVRNSLTQTEQTYCSREVFFVPINSILNYWNASIITTP